MKRLLVIVCVIGVLGTFSLAQAELDTLTILHLNDTHSHLLPYGPKDAEGNWTWGGMARIGTLVGMIRMTEPNVMLLHAGDIFVGDFMFQKYLGVAELEVMKGLGYDAMALGNHEFDFFPSTLKYVLNEAGFPAEGFPVLCANLDVSGDPELGNFIQPYAIMEYDGLKVGVFGLLTEWTNQMANPSPVVVLPPLSVAQAWVDSLKVGHDCDLVILLSHLSADFDPAVASSVSGIDIIVGGHSHTVIESPIQIGNTLVLQAGEFGRFVGKLSIVVDAGTKKSWEYQLMSVDSSVPEEPTVAAMIDNLAAEVEADPRFGPVYTDVVAQTVTELRKPLGEGLFKDNALGNLASDAFRDETGTRIAFQPQGFISQTIYQGDVKGADIFQAVPYGFDEVSGLGLKLVTFETDGMSIISGLEFSVYNLPHVEDFFLHGSNLSYVYNLADPPGSRVDYSTITIGGQPLDPSATYSVTVPDEVVPFLNQIPGFQVNNLLETGLFVYNVVRDLLISHSPVAYYSEGRVIDLSILSDPAEGAAALSEAVGLYLENGSIDNHGIANSFKSQLNAVHSLLQAGKYEGALGSLKAFRNHVRAQSGKHIRSESAQVLLYLAGKLEESILSSPIGTETPEGDGPVRGDFQLLEPHPNPFNPQTQIAYILPEDSYVRLTVYNLIGQEVKVLMDGYQTAGTKTVIWDGRAESGEKVANGIYLCRLQAGGRTQTKKMVLVK
ncbi:MAG: T9SS type A sorting domain-containing protein [candidate division Zixibacteria bacterium]|nr:T9SS type A sorting domain-containing protein [candidate division Zixibacteria bacterium]